MRDSRLHHLGDVGHGAGDPAGVASAPGGKVLVALAGVGEVAVGGGKDSRWQRVAVGRRPTAVALSPGWLRSEQMLDNYGVSEANWHDATAKQPHFVISETPRYVGRAVAHLAGDPEVARWSGESLSSGQLAKVYGFTDVDGSQPDAWRYVREVQDAGKPADATGYR